MSLGELPALPGQRGLPGLLGAQLGVAQRLRPPLADGERVTRIGLVTAGHDDRGTADAAEVLERRERLGARDRLQGIRHRVEMMVLPEALADDAHARCRATSRGCG